MSAKTPAAIIYDVTGTNPVAVIVDGGVYRLGVDAKVTSSALPAGAATEATLGLVKAKTDNLDTALSTRASDAGLSAIFTRQADGSQVAQVNDGGGSITIDAVSLPLPAGAATQATLVTLLTEADFDARVGNVAASPTANTILGRLKDLYDRFIAQLPAALVGGRLDTNIGAWLGSTAPTVGQKTKANSVPVTFASDQEPIAIFVASPADSIIGIATGTVTLGGSTANTVQAVRGTLYAEQSANAVRSLKSTSAADAVAGTGARKVKITYFAADMTGPFTETVTMNGLTAVALVASNVCFIESLFVTEVGSGGANAGTINLYTDNAGAGSVIGSIGSGNVAGAGGDNRTFWAHHYVPIGKTVTLSTFIVSAVSGGSGTNATFFLRAKNPLLALAPDVIISDLLVTVASIVRQLTNPIKILGPARVTAFGVPAVNNAQLNATFDFSEKAT